jgi:C-terminal processing protease CtpA/Prc
MNQTLSLALRLMWVSIWLAGCGGGLTPTEISSTPIPTETKQIPTSTPLSTATPIPTATSTAQLLPISAEATAYLNEALDIIQKNSLYRETIDWDQLRQATFEVAKYAQTPADTYGAIRFALVRLGDHHSSFFTRDELEQTVGLTASDNPPPRVKLLLEKVGFIAIEGFWGFDGDTYATDAQQLIREIDAQNPCGWIVDLRENSGGNMWPMMAAIGPILGEGEVGAFIDSYGNKEIWSYQDGQVMLDGRIQNQVSDPYQLKAAAVPVAVLTGVSTASSGEAITTAFRGRPNTRSFGGYTAGLTTANQFYPLSDGAGINLANAVGADRTGQVYRDRIDPDEVVDDLRQFTVIMEEAIPQPAIDWLMSQSACSEQK